MIQKLKPDGGDPADHPTIQGSMNIDLADLGQGRMIPLGRDLHLIIHIIEEGQDLGHTVMTLIGPM